MRSVYQVKHKVLLVICVALLLVIIPMQAHAGSLSKGERRLVRRAEKTFTYNGGVYFAYGKSIDKLNEYLKQDHLTLSEPLLEKAERYMKDPVYIRMAIASGYLYPVGVKGGKPFPEFDEDKRFKDDAEFLDSEFYRVHGGALDAELLEVSAQSTEQQIVLRKFTLTSGKAAKNARKAVVQGEYAAILWIRRVLWIVEILVCLAIVILALGKKDNRLERAAKVILTVGVGVNIALMGAGLVFRTTLGSYQTLKHSAEKSTMMTSARDQMYEEMQKVLIREGLSDRKAADFVIEQIFENEYRYVFLQKLRGVSISKHSSGINEASIETLKPKGVNKKIVALETEYNLRRAYKRAIALQPAGFIHSLWWNIRFVLNGVFSAGVLLLLGSLLFLLKNGRKEDERVHTGIVLTTLMRGFLTAAGVFIALSIGLSVAMPAIKSAGDVLGAGNFPSMFMQVVRLACVLAAVSGIIVSVILRILRKKIT